MKKVSFRIIAVVAALIIATGLVLALTYAGNSTKGPVESAMTYTGNVVTKIEQKLIVNQREEKRSDRLKWLQPYFNSKQLLLHPPKILLGAFDNEAIENYESIVSLEDTLKTTFPLIQIYTAWGSKPEEKFPVKNVKDILALGSIPVITWEPWLNDFTQEDYGDDRPADEHNKNGMKDIAAGKYDKYIRQWAATAAQIRKPLFLRLAHEMNDGYRYPWGPQNNTPEDFIAAWRHVHDLFIAQHATNIVWVWSPHPAYKFDEFYPGKAYADYVGVGVLNYGNIAAWSKWWSFDEIFGNYYRDLASYKKPIIITEFGSLTVGGNRTKWYAKALRSMPEKYPMVRSVLFFHFAKDNTTTQQTLNWYIKDDRPLCDTIVAAMKNWNDQNWTDQPHT